MTGDRWRIALYQPDIAANTGAILRLGACLGIGVEIIGPAGFAMSDRMLRRSGMDYLSIAEYTMHADWNAFKSWQGQENRRLILLTTKSCIPYTDCRFHASDVILFGRESAGVPDRVRNACDIELTIPMPGGGRSLNLAMSVAIVAGEVSRQLSRAGGV